MFSQCSSNTLPRLKGGDFTVNTPNASSHMVTNGGTGEAQRRLVFPQIPVFAQSPVPAPTSHVTATPPQSPESDIHLPRRGDPKSPASRHTGGPSFGFVPCKSRLDRGFPFWGQRYYRSHMPFPRPREKVASLGHYWRQHCARGRGASSGVCAAASLCP